MWHPKKRDRNVHIKDECKNINMKGAMGGNDRVWKCSKIILKNDDNLKVNKISFKVQEHIWATSDQPCAIAAAGSLVVSPGHGGGGGGGDRGGWSRRGGCRRRRGRGRRRRGRGGWWWWCQIREEFLQEQKPIFIRVWVPTLLREKEKEKKRTFFVVKWLLI